jgi:hypothetical protein
VSNRISVLKGVVRGRIIELERESGLPEGQPVTVTVQVAEVRLVPGEGIRRSAGAWADDATGLDGFLEWNRQRRKATRGGDEA